MKYLNKLLASLKYCRIDTQGFVPSDRERFIGDTKKLVKFFIKYLKRHLIFFITAQVFFSESAISKDHKKILWINLSAPSIGDVLMDSAGRVLLDGKRVHALLAPSVAELFCADRVFSKVFTRVKDAKQAHLKDPYDLILLDARGSRSLQAKLRVSFFLEYVDFYGYLNGFEVHRTYYSFRRIARLLSRENLNFSVRESPSINLTANGTDGLGSYGLPREYWVVAVGGEWAFRTYAYWGDVISGLDPNINVVLIGSDNGLRDADAILLSCSDRRFVLSLVGRTNLGQVAQLIREARLFIGADGGLSHIAGALGVPSVVLYADCQLRDLRDRRVARNTDDQAVKALISERTVNEISPQEILGAVREYIASQHKLLLKSDS